MKHFSRKRTLIDRIFREIVKRGMTARERQVLLPEPRKSRKRHSALRAN
jgi:hypothetical protein